MNLRPDERVLIGSWRYVDQLMRGDDVCDRIEALIAHQLRKIAASPQWGDWETLFQDPSDGRFWERTYPQGDLHGGGPPQLQLISEDEARAKYKCNI